MLPSKLYRSFFKRKKKPNNPKEEGKSTLAHAAYSGVQITLRLLADSLDGVPAPGLQGAIKGILFIMDNIDRASQNLDDFESLRSHLEACQSVFAQYKSESLPPAIKEAIQTLSRRIQDACSCINQIVDRCRVRRIWASSADALLFRTKVREIDNALAQFQVATATFNSLQISDQLAISRRMLIERLTNVEGAHYNSRERRHVTPCLPNTRVHVINRIMDWIHDPTASPVFWLNSTAGTGKSTVAQSIAEMCAGNNVLAGHFFFSRDKQNRFSADGFFSTLATQVYTFELRVVPHLANAVLKSASLSGVRNREMFSRFLVQPLLQLRREVPGLLFPMVVVIDALDECRDAKDAAEILTLILNNDLGQQSPPILKFLITSRPEPHIRKVFDVPTNKGPPPKFTEFVLGTDPTDVDLYLRKGLADIRTDRSEFFAARRAAWPEPYVYKKLLTKSAGLFIYASTILKFVANEYEDPIQQLKLVMDTKAPQARMYGELDSLYTQIISQVPNLERVHRTVGTITLVFEPLSATQLELLLGLNEGHAQLALRWLQSVLVVPTDNQQPVRLAHPSFHDFLTTKERSGALYLDPSVQHGKLVVACMNVLRVGYPGWQTSKKDASLARKGLLVYACRFWPYHLSKSDSSDSTLSEAVDDFLRSFIRVWFDAFIEFKLLNEFLASLSEIFRSAIPGTRPELVAFLCHEMDRFGVLISTKYMHLRYVAPLAIAEGLFERAIGHFPGDRPPHFKYHYGSVQRRVYQQHFSRQDLTNAVATQEAAVRSLPYDHTDRGVYLTELAVCYRLSSRLQKKTPDIQPDIEKSISLLQEGLKLMADQDRNKSVCCNSYGFVLIERFEAKGNISDLHQAVERFEQALSLPSPSPSITAAFLNNLGSALANRFKHLRVDADASAAMSALQAASNHPSASPSVAFKASLSLARCSKSHGRDSPLPAYLLALKKAIRISWTALPDDEARRLFREVISCGEEASIVAIKEGDDWCAIECFDQSCTTFWMDGLRLCGAFFPDSQEQSRLQGLAVSLEREGGQEPTCILGIDRGELHPSTETEALVLEYDGLLHSPSDVVEMSLPLRYKQFIATHPNFAGEGGRIILLCADESQTFALVLKSDAEDVITVPLPLDRKRLAELVQRGKALWNSSWTPPGFDGKVILQDSWNLVAKPVIDALRLKRGVPLTRTWWCASVPFMDLPIHAATDYGTNPHEYVTDYMISSYIPSLSYFLNKNYNGSSTGRSGLLCLPTNPHPTWESGADQDIPAISRIVPQEQLLLLPELTETKQILLKMRGCSGVHVASQSEQRNENPADGRFSLPNGVFLELNQLLPEPSFPRFAYLSTYPTTNGWAKGPPTCRLAYDLLAIGFSSIVATQAPLSPEDAAAMTSEFYSEIQARGNLDFAFAAHALHSAMTKIRDECGSTPKGSWIRTVHVGF